MSSRGRPPGDLLREAAWRKERALAWFHKVTSEMTEEQVITACKLQGLDVEGKTLHDLQTRLLQIGSPD